jgi:hypothetical protein
MHGFRSLAFLVLLSISRSDQLPNRTDLLCKHVFECQHDFQRVHNQSPVECNVLDLITCEWHDQINLTKTDQLDFESILTSKYNYDNTHFKWLLTDTNQVLYYSKHTVPTVHPSSNHSNCTANRNNSHTVWFKSDKFQFNDDFAYDFNLTCQAIPKWSKKFKTTSPVKYFLLSGANRSVRIVNDNQIQQCTFSVHNDQQLPFLNNFSWVTVWISLATFALLFTATFLVCCFLQKRQDEAKKKPDLDKLGSQLQMMKPVFVNDSKKARDIDKLLANLKNGGQEKPFL